MIVDLRSDTVTRPSPAMREAVAAAPVGDDQYVARAKERGVLVFAFAARTVRLVTHLDVSLEQCEGAADILRGVVDG